MSNTDAVIAMRISLDIGADTDIEKLNRYGYGICNIHFKSAPFTPIHVFQPGKNHPLLVSVACLVLLQ